ncbi:MAG: HAD family hydrolase [Sandaracinaceae bacterium]|nr:HAD family hydrolase [Sandaracinaceae bacterium]
MRAYDLILLDFDGTFTDVDAEAVPFLAHYRRGLAELAGAGIDEAWEAAVEVVREAPDAHGFRFEGRIVAPSHADPYILSSCVSQLVLEQLGLEVGPSALETLFHASYRHAGTVFRPDARDVIEAVLALGVPVYVVSNSRTDNVRAKLASLDPALLERLEVRGDARKFHLVEPEGGDARFDAVPEARAVEGLARPLYLRRGRYFDALRAIWDATGAQPARTLVCGDIYELDLALPAALGAAVHLVGRPTTPAWERDAATSARGAFSTALAGLLDRLR